MPTGGLSTYFPRVAPPLLLNSRVRRNAFGLPPCASFEAADPPQSFIDLSQPCSPSLPSHIPSQLAVRYHLPPVLAPSLPYSGHLVSVVTPTLLRSALASPFSVPSSFVGHPSYAILDIPTPKIDQPSGFDGLRDHRGGESRRRHAEK